MPGEIRSAAQRYGGRRRLQLHTSEHNSHSIFVRDRDHKLLFRGTAFGRTVLGRNTL
jgi:hypothetical protein